MRLFKFLFRCPRGSEKDGAPFSVARDFKELFTLLHEKRVLWGSQKGYSAPELNVLINRVRTSNQTLRLPLEVIPETGGPRQRVQELREEEALDAGIPMVACCAFRPHEAEAIVM